MQSLFDTMPGDHVELWVDGEHEELTRPGLENQGAQEVGDSIYIEIRTIVNYPAVVLGHHVNISILQTNVAFLASPTNMIRIGVGLSQKQLRFTEKLLDAGTWFFWERGTAWTRNGNTTLADSINRTWELGEEMLY